MSDLKFVCSETGFRASKVNDEIVCAFVTARCQNENLKMYAVFLGLRFWSG